MATAGFLARSYPARANERDFWWIAHALIIGAIVFNAILCFVNTHFAPVTNRTVILSEVIIVGATIIVCYKSLNLLYVFLLSGVIFLTLTLALIRASISPEAGVDVKIARDFLIPIVFFMLGQRTSDLKCADSIVNKSLFLILAFALFEFFSLENFLKVFAVAQYYVARGTLEDSSWALDVAGGLMASGMRPPEQGRGILSFLGDHRVSSLFLEPIGMGNFGCIAVLWTVVRSRMEHKWYVWSTLTGLALIILSDTRFDANFIVVGVIILFLPPRVSSLGVSIMPIIIPIGLIFLYLVYASELPDTPSVAGLGLIDRLVYSGRVLAEFDLYHWLGVKVSALQTFDAGYAYLISNAGIYGYAIFWGIFLSLKGYNRHFYALRNASAAYFAILFCISASQMTIKTAALQWFLLGTLAVMRPYERTIRTHQPTDNAAPAPA